MPERAFCFSDFVHIKRPSTNPPATVEIYEPNAHFVLHLRLSPEMLPFGAISMEGSVNVVGPGLTDIRVDGFEEVFEGGTQVVMVNGHPYRVCTLAGIVILKLIAYDDRPEHRPKDILDISFILKHYFDIAEAEIYERHDDLFDWPDFDMGKAAARVMGRQMQPIVRRSVELQKRIETILDHQLELGEESKVART